MVEEQKAYEIETKFNKTGNGFREKVTPEFIENVRLLADLLVIKTNDITPWYETKNVVVSNTTEEKLYGAKVRSGKIVVLTHVSMKNATHTGTTMQIAIERGGETIVLNRDVPSAVNISIDWDGQVLLSENDRIKISHFGASSSDLLDFSASGYEIKA